jgi:nicotinate-nucleotide adenylyltransferase
MLNLAVEGQPIFRVSELEGDLSGPSFTVNTLKAVSGLMDVGAELFFLVGFDSFRSVGHWHGYADLFRLASFAVFRRPGLGSELSSVCDILTDILGPDPEIIIDAGGCSGQFVFPGAKPIYYYADCLLEISSTDLRNRLDLGTSVRYLVPESVREYIINNSLYHSQPRVNEV